MRIRFSSHLVYATLLSLAAFGASATEPAMPSVEINAEGSAEAANDLATAVAYFEATDSNPAGLSEKVNKTIAQALALTKDYPSVKVSTAGTSTYPIYDRDGRTLSAWRMRSQIRLESRDIAAMSTLIGKLQARLAVSQINLEPAPETRRTAENLATVAAISDFRRRAQLIADTLGRKYRIQRLSVNQSGTHPPVYMRAKVAMATAEAAPAPIEGGESTVSVNINGTVELTD